MKANQIQYAIKRHQDWLSMARKLGADDYCEDVVQEMYLKLLELKNLDIIMYNETELNGFYIYVIIKNLVFDLNKAKSKYQMVSIDEVLNIQQDENLIEYEHSFIQKIETLKNETEKWYWYDKMLFNIYHSTGMSIRKLSQETNISASSIFNTLKVCKQKIIIAHKIKTNG